MSLIIIFLAAQAAFAPVAASNVGNRDALRAWVGIDLFPAIVAADAQLAAKAGPDNTLKLILVYTKQASLAQEMATRLNLIGHIRDLPIQATPASLSDLFQSQPPAAIFLVERIGESLAEILTFGATHRVLIFSPFDGDVERGVPTGMIVTDRILPHINLQSLFRSQITLKPFFLRIAVPHR